MTVHLRAHHLLCTLTYIGRGYSPAFVAGFDSVLQRLASGEEVLLVSGPDELCRPLRGDPAAHCHRDSVRQRDALAADQLRSEQGLALNTQADGAGSRFLPSDALLHRLREAFAAGRVRAACAGCEWSPLCSDVADQGFAAVRWVAVRSAASGPPVVSAAQARPSCRQPQTANKLVKASDPTSTGATPTRPSRSR